MIPTKSYKKYPQYQCEQAGCPAVFLDTKSQKIHIKSHTVQKMRPAVNNQPYEKRHNKSQAIQERGASDMIPIKSYKNYPLYQCEQAGCPAVFLDTKSQKIHIKSHTVQKMRPAVNNQPYEKRHNKSQAIQERGASDMIPIKSYKNYPLYQCEQAGCPAVFLDTKSQKIHIKSHTVQKMRPAVNNQPYEKRHNKSQAIQERGASDMIPIKSYKNYPLYQCEQAGCPAVFLDTKSQKIHIKSHTVQKMRPVNTSEAVNNQPYEKRHNKSQAIQERGASDMIQHTDEHLSNGVVIDLTEEEPNIIDLTAEDEDGPRENYLIRRSRMINGTYCCLVCDKIFSNGEDVLNHYRIHRPNRMNRTRYN